MPYFIDRHELCDLTTPESAAQRNLEDLKIQHKFSCRKISYWFDEKQHTAFCLFEAPDKESLRAMHKEAHANVPNQIIEVDLAIVDSFLKKIRCFPNIQELELQVALPTFLACDLGLMRLNVKPLQLKSIRKSYNTSAKEAIKKFDGDVISQIGTFFLIAFQSASTAIKCALKMHKRFYENKTEWEHKHQLKIGVSGGIPDNNVKASIKLAQRLCYLAKDKILLTLEVKNHIDSNGLKAILKEDRVKSLPPDDVDFIGLLLKYMEGNWKNPNLHANNFEEQLNCSKSQIYRKMISLTGQSPNTFIKAYRLTRAAELLCQKRGNVSEIAFDTGFNSASYFTKCFQKEYGLKPSQYISELT
jgi:AraC-like DNA-binding protein